VGMLLADALVYLLASFGFSGVNVTLICR